MSLLLAIVVVVLLVTVAVAGAVVAFVLLRDRANPGEDR